MFIVLTLVAKATGTEVQRKLIAAKLSLFSHISIFVYIFFIVTQLSKLRVTNF